MFCRAFGRKSAHDSPERLFGIPRFESGSKEPIGECDACRCLLLRCVADFQHVIGIVTVSDFLHSADHLNETNETLENENKASIAERLAHLCQRTDGFESDKPEVAGQIMTSPVITALASDNVADLVAHFTRHTIHHIPIVDEKRKLLGMLTREDVLAARDRSKHAAE